MTLNSTTRLLMDNSRRSPDMGKMVDEELAGLDSRISAMDGAGEIPIENMEDARGSGMIIVTDGDKSPAYVQMTGDASISNTGAVSLSDNSVEQANMSDDSIGVAELKIVERDITIDGGAASGSVTNAEDIDDRVERRPMYKAERKAVVKEFGLGLILFIVSYVLLTAYREFRDNFMPEILNELGYGGQTALFTKTELPIAIIVLLLMASMRWVTNHTKAFLIIQSLLLLGAVIIALCTLLYQMQIINPIFWLIGVGFGAYVAYSMCNSLYFERMLAAFKYTATVGFMITLADYYAYFGSLTVLFYKNFFHTDTPNVTFFVYASYFLSGAYFLMVVVSMFYFIRKRNSFSGTNR